MSNPNQEWSAVDVSGRVRLTEESVASRLKELHTARLLAAREGPSTLYRYAPDSSALAEEVAQSLDQAYKERKDSVIQLIFSRPLDNISVFADAFRIKRKD